LAHTRSIDDAARILAQIASPLRAEQLDRRRQFEWQANYTVVGSLGIVASRYEAAIRADAEHLAERYVLLAPLASGGFVEQAGPRADLAPGRSGALVSCGLPTHVQLGSGFSGLQVTMTRTTLEAALGSLIGAPCSVPIRFELQVDIASGPGASLLRLLDFILNEANQPNSVLLAPAVAARVSEAFVYGLLLGLPHNHSEGTRAPAACAVPRAVARAEEYMAANACEPITSADVAAVAGVGARALYAAFHAHRGYSPMTFLRERRFELARARLLAAPHSTVGAVALDAGFEHLGRFSVGYRQRYGETPTETLRRVRAQ
jgi:AraC-like DNA-binding protein